MWVIGFHSAVILQIPHNTDVLFCFLNQNSLFFKRLVSTDCDQARTIFEKATKVNYKQVDDLAAVWCEYGEMELRHENYEQALRILRVRYLTGDV